ncbi:hypothetical protein DFJ77DRAFT_261663 [Powellomyces hirtus]|nr:hypothetical protein DFJ77DRAFT_261663 [Powellomyces hirtus]
MSLVDPGTDPGPGTPADVRDVRAAAKSIERGLRGNSAYWAFKKLVQTEALASPAHRDIASVAKGIFERSGGVGQRIQNHVRLACRTVSSSRAQQHPVQWWWTPRSSDRTVFRTDHLVLDPRVRKVLDAAQKGLMAAAKKQVARVAVEMDVPLARRRTRQEEAIFLQYAFATRPDDPPAPVSSNSTLPAHGGPRDPDRVCLYDDQDLLDALLGTVPPAGLGTGGNTLPPDFSAFWSSIPIDLAAPPVLLEELAYKYAELHPRYEQIGMDDVGFSSESAIQAAHFLHTRITAGEAILSRRCFSRASMYARQGVPTCLRARLWDLLLQSELIDDPATYTQKYCKPLKAALAQHELLVDHLVQADARQCRNDDAFFVFEDVLKEMMLFWIRDEWIDARLCPAAPAAQATHSPPQPSPPKSASIAGATLPPVGRAVAEGTADNNSNGNNNGVGNGKAGSTTTTLPTTAPATPRVIVKKYPPNGVLPFWGVSCYAMPVCFLHADAESAYMTFRELYVCCFTHLHTLQPSRTTPTLPHLLAHFESLIKQYSAPLFHHVARVAHAPPARLAARWIVFAFVGVLDVAQVLLLWDRVLGYGPDGDGLALFAVAAAALFAFREDVLWAARSTRDVEAAFADLGGIEIVPLLQNFIFPLVCDDDDA